MPGADLHAHTTASDGSLTPTELVRLAVESGLEALAVTDHDTLDGLPEALVAASALGIELIPGIELAVTCPNGRFHMLGLFIDFGAPILNEKLDLLKANRIQRNDRMILRLNELGLEITRGDLIRESGGGQIGRGF